MFLLDRSSLPCSTTLIVLTSSLCQSSFPSPGLQSFHYIFLLKCYKSFPFFKYCLCFISLWIITGKGKKSFFLGAGPRYKPGIHLPTGRRTNNALPYITLAITNLILMLTPLPSFCFVPPNPGYHSFFSWYCPFLVISIVERIDFFPRILNSLTRGNKISAEK